MKKLKEFSNSVEANLFTHDVGFQQSLSYLHKPAEADRLFGMLEKWEEKMPNWDLLAAEAARPEKFPRIQKYDRVGKLVEKIILPLETQTIRREVVKAGIFAENSEVEKFAKIYLLCQLGESGVTCPLACTDGLIRVVQAHGTDYVKKTYLPMLASLEYPLAGAQFITEQAGGSDIGAIEGTAKKTSEGHYLLTAEKWYCSAADEFFLIAARPDGAPAGTDGIAIFFVPRVIKKGDEEIPNNLSIRRLKDKLGTQSLPTAEIDFNDSVAYLLGKEEDGFHHLMNHVLNCSRIHNAANALGFLRRAFAEARNYAEQRFAFGKSIINFPLVQQYLLSMLTQLTAHRNFYFTMLSAVDKNGFLPEDNEQRLWQRYLINLMKYRTASQLTEGVKTAVLVFGANGIVQDFSIVPRLLRDSLIIETWEGTHNILCLQILKDSQRFDFWTRLKKEVNQYLNDWPQEVLPKSRKLFASAIQRGEELITPAQLKDSNWVQTHARRVVDYYADLLEIGNLVKQGVAQDNSNVLLQAAYLSHEWLSGVHSGFENPVVGQLSEVGLALIREEAIKVDLKNY